MYPNLAPPPYSRWGEGAAHGRAADFWGIPAGRAGTPIRGSFLILNAFRLMLFSVGSSMGRSGLVDPRSNIGFTAIPRDRRPPAGGPRPSGKMRRGGVVPRKGVPPPSLIASRLLFSVLVHQWWPLGVADPRSNVGFITIPRNRRPPVGGPRRILLSIRDSSTNKKTGRLYSCDQTRRRLEPYIHNRPDTVPKKKARAL